MLERYALKGASTVLRGAGDGNAASLPDPPSWRLLYMRTAISLVIMALVPAFALADPPTKLYYVGEAKLSSPEGNALGSQVYLLEKTLDRDKARITERAVIVRADGKAEEWTLRFAVKEDGTFTLTEDSKRAEGSGKLFGPAWKWTYFKAAYKSTNGIQVEDENFFADESFGTARLKLTRSDGKVLMYMDISLKSITPKTYEILRAGLLKK
jgi:hypothetical protein